ncbi:MAG: cell surface protein SprA [Candidatus Cloacimonetes bacterium]|nr:cell surface protein SprA [Candidatus Cloacimonadota bacterium]
MKNKSVFPIIFLFLIGIGYTLLQYNAIQAETVIHEGKETSHEVTEKVTDSAGEVHEDTLLIATDTLFIETPELGITDTISQTDTLNLTEQHEKQQDSVRVKEKKKKYIQRTSSFPILFNYPFSMPLMAKKDSAEVMNYLLKEVFPRKKFSRYFDSYSLYAQSDDIDIRKKRVLVSSTFGDARIHAPFAVGLPGYMNARFREKFYNMMIVDIDEAEQLRLQDRESQGIIPDIEFPKIKMPKAMQRFFGDNIGRLKVTGSQKITIGGSSTIRKPEVVTEGTKKGFFPDLKMEQKLNLGISGTIGKKIKVEVKQTSDESIFEKNKISIKYVGDEDDPIKLIELGDTRLSLSGSQFLSYSASSEDLFGIKGEFEFGKLRLTTIVSQQEGQQASASATGNAVEQETDYLDKSFVRNKYFLFNQPDSLFLDAQGHFVNPDTLPMTEWYYIADKMPKQGTVQVFIDDGNFDPAIDVTGYDQHGNEYKFRQLTDPIKEFFIDYENAPYMIQFGVGISDNYAIGVIYEEVSGKKWGEYIDGVPHVKMIKKSYLVPSSELPDAKWNYQVKNIYSLGGTNIDPQDFDVKIFYEDPDNNGNETFEITINNVQHKLIDILDLDTNGDGKVNGSDETIDLEKGIAQFRMWEPFQPYWFSDYSSTLGNPMVYNERNPDITDYNPFYVRVKSNTVGSTINLGHINIIEGSEKVYVDGELMKKGVDYDIDYFSGTVRLKGDAASDPNAVVKVDFEYKPFFNIDKKSMFGVRADYEFNDNAKIGATFMYEGGSTGNKHVKVGGEPTKAFVGDIDGSIRAELPFVTDLVDMIPLVRTKETSTVNLSGEVAMNIPDPNATDKGEAYIDDMEAINEIFSIGLSRTEYDFASWPLIIDSLMIDSLITRGDFSWYNPHNVYQKKDIYPDLPEQEGREYVSVLECKLDPLSSLPNWGGIMKSFGRTAEDVEKKKYLELTYKAKDADQGDTLFINLGTMSEDYYPITHPNNVLNYEDLNQDGVLDAGEDVGLDNVQGTDPVPPKSHEFDGIEGIDDGNDDYNYSAGSTDYSGINGAEVNGRLDTEDLNKNYVLDTRNNYFQYAIDLKNVDPEVIISEYNDWMFIRIPLQDTLYFKPLGQGGVAWDYIQSVRLWMKTETSDDKIIDIETFELVGNKWVASTIMDTTLHKPSNLQPDEVFEVATENNLNNPDYTPPPGSLIDDDDKEKEIEQSLVLNIQNLEPDRYVYAKETFSEKLDLLNYSKVKLWVYAQHATGPPPNASNTETIVFRLGADTSNYYEYRQPVQVYDDIDTKMLESRWQGITIDFTEFTNLKRSDVPDTTSRLRIVGNPSLGYVKQVVVGLVRPDSMQTSFSGRIFFDDIRVSDAYGEVGMAARLTLDTKFADFADLQLSFERKTPNFYSLGATGGSNQDSYSYSLRNNLYLHKFLPGDWGFNIPLKFDYTYGESKPRFKPNSDVKLTTSEEKNEYKTLSETRNASLSLRKSKKSTNFFSKLLLDNTFIKATVQQSKTLSPTKRDTTLKYTGTFDYTLNIGKKLLTLKIFEKFNFYFVPQKIILNTNYTYSKFNSWSKQVQDTVFINDKKAPVHTLNPKLTVNYELFTDFDADYILNMTRDLTKTNKVGNLNIGVESSRNQDVTLEYVPQFMKFFNFNTKYKTIYKQSRRENLQNDSLSIQYEVENEKTTSANVTLKFSKWGKDIMELIDIEEVVEKDGKEEIIEEEEEKEEIPEIDERELEDIERKKQMENEDPELGKQNELIDSVQVEKIEEEITEKDDGRAAFNFQKMVMYVTKVVGYSVKMLGNADFSYTNTYKTKYFAPPDSLPGIYYQLGLRDQTAGSIQSTGQSDAFSVNTRTTFEVFSFLSADLNAKYTIDLTKASGNKTKSESIVLPGVMLSFNSIDKLLKAKFMTGSNLSTSFTRLISNTGQGFWETPEQTTEKYQFTPLLSFNTKLLNKINTNLGFNYTFSDQKSYTGNFKQTHTNEMGLSMTFRYSFQAAKGIKIPLLGRLKMNNKTDIDLNVSYTSNRSQYTDTSNQQWQDANHKNVLKIEPRIAYNFSRDINAGLTARYESSKDVKAETSSTTTAINIWVEFKF